MTRSPIQQQRRWYQWGSVASSHCSCCLCLPRCGCRCGSSRLHTGSRSQDKAIKWFSAQPLPKFKGFTKVFFSNMVFYNCEQPFSHTKKTIFLPYVQLYVLTMQEQGSTRNRKENTFLKVPQSKFWWSGLAPAAGPQKDRTGRTGQQYEGFFQDRYSLILIPFRSASATSERDVVNLRSPAVAFS